VASPGMTPQSTSQRTRKALVVIGRQPELCDHVFLSHPCSTSAVDIPEGYVRLILLHEEDSTFYLEIPLDTINHLCLKTQKYLAFLGWCILGSQAEGGLSLERDGVEISNDEALDNGTIYYTYGL